MGHCRWSWADYAVLQGPRLTGAIALTAHDAVLVDLALRVGQAAMTPLLAFYPVVLPRASAAWERGGLAETGRLIAGWANRGVPWLVAAVVIVTPAAPLVVAVWANTHVSTAGAVGVALVSGSLLAYASTGLFTSALLATATLGPVTRYKAAQLGGGAVALACGAALGMLALCAGLAAALVVPAVWFNGRAVRVLGLGFARGGRLIQDRATPGFGSGGRVSRRVDSGD